MVRMAQDFAMRVPLVDGHGNFGSVDGDCAAAMRYTESRLHRMAMELLRDLDKETVDFGPNYDESLHGAARPARAATRTCSSTARAGIAVGMATNIPPHNLGEVIDATIMLIDNPEATVEELMTVLPGPGLPDRRHRSWAARASATPTRPAAASLKVRGKAHIEQTSTGRTRIIITEIPYQVNKSKLVTKIAELVREKKLTEISDLRDESDRKGMRVVIELKQALHPAGRAQQALQAHAARDRASASSCSRSSTACRARSTLPQMLKYYIEHQKEVIVRRTRYELRKAEERAHILEGYVIALDNIDEVIKIIRASRRRRGGQGRASSSASGCPRSRPTRSSRCACAA